MMALWAVLERLQERIDAVFLSASAAAYQQERVADFKLLVCRTAGVGEPCWRAYWRACDRATSSGHSLPWKLANLQPAPAKHLLHYYSWHCFDIPTEYSVRLRTQSTR